MRKSLAPHLIRPSPSFAASSFSLAALGSFGRLAPNQQVRWGHSAVLGRARGVAIASSTASVFKRHMFIQTQDTPNPQSLKFLPGQEVLPAGETANFSSYKQAQRSPLAKALFAIEGVQGVYFANDFISVTIFPEQEWSHIKPEVFGAISDFFASNQPVLTPADGDTKEDEKHDDASESFKILDTDDELVALIKELLETRVRPHVQQDGGDLVYRGFEKGVVKLQLQGSCVGCSSSSATLKGMIQNMLCHYIPEVDSVEEWVDEELQAVSRSQLKELEDRLQDAQVENK
eukprot:gb/GEZN01008697.1/.p1 GENE.gb/GEZN01008697.1/~~gb/GEZN01008697.1/.p1  ORF type:complete len:300 (-),score=37.64 gb/GEZN01008697.1/:502-1368(-)